MAETKRLERARGVGARRPKVARVCANCGRKIRWFKLGNWLHTEGAYAPTASCIEVHGAYVRAIATPRVRL